MSTISAYTGDGSTTQFDVTFFYRDSSTVKASLDGVETTAFTFINPSRIEFDDAPADGVEIKIFRKTEVSSAAVTFEDGAIVLGSDLNEAVAQPRERVEEIEADVNAITEAALKAPVGEALPTLPSAEERVDGYLAFGAEGAPIIVQPPGSDLPLRSDLAATGGFTLLGYQDEEAGSVPLTGEAILRELPLTPQRFGAVGDGEAEDTAALVAWLAALQASNKEGYIPDGRYLVERGALEWAPLWDSDDPNTVPDYPSESETPAPKIRTGPNVTIVAKANPSTIGQPLLHIHNSPFGSVNWQPNTAYSVGDQMTVYNAGASATSYRPIGNEPAFTSAAFTGHNTAVYVCTTAGTSSNSTVPTTAGTPATINDNGVVWTYVGNRQNVYISDGYIGDLTFEDTEAQSYGSASSGLQLYGVQRMRFGTITSKDGGGIQGDVIHIERRGNDITADAWHVHACLFEGCSAEGGDEGWAFNNDSLTQVFNLGTIGHIRAVGNRGGLLRGCGSMNTFVSMSSYASGSSLGAGEAAVEWGIHTGNAAGSRLLDAEIDAPVAGAIRVFGLTNSSLRARITYRSAAADPLYGIKFEDVSTATGGTAQLIVGCDFHIHQRLSGVSFSTVSSLCEHSTTAAPIMVDCEVRQTYSGATPSTTAHFEKMRQNFMFSGTEAGCRITVANAAGGASRELFNLTPVFKSFQAGASSGSLSTSLTAVSFDTELWDNGGMLSGSTFTAPSTGLYRVTAILTFAPAVDGDAVQMAFGTVAGDPRLTAIYRANGTSVQSFMLSGLVRLDTGDTCNLKASVGSGTPALAATGVSNGTVAEANYLAVEQLS